jgi:hypothetical protein
MSVNLARGAQELANRGVLVRHLNAITRDRPWRPLTRDQSFAEPEPIVI